MHNIGHIFIIGHPFSIITVITLLFFEISLNCKDFPCAKLFIERFQHFIIDHLTLLEMYKVVFRFVTHHFNNCSDEFAKSFHCAPFIDKLLPITLLRPCVEVTFFLFGFIIKVILPQYMLSKHQY
jgi:hypothetical protein